MMYVSRHSKKPADNRRAWDLVLIWGLWPVVPLMWEEVEVVGRRVVAPVEVEVVGRRVVAPVEVEVVGLRVVAPVDPFTLLRVAASKKERQDGFTKRMSLAACNFLLFVLERLGSVYN
jgi:hypothetical protein